MLGLLYVLFLVTMVVVLSFKAKGVRENYREAMYIGLTMGFTVCIFLVWILGGFIAPPEYQVLTEWQKILWALVYVFERLIILCRNSRFSAVYYRFFHKLHFCNNTAYFTNPNCSTPLVLHVPSTPFWPSRKDWKLLCANIRWWNLFQDFGGH